jgi:colanic acid biosynthesis glycosyl transferase WcaI
MWGGVFKLARGPGTRGGSGGAKVASSRLMIHGMNFAPELIGVGKYTGDLAAFLAARGHEVEVITAPPHYPGWQVQTPYAPFRYTVEIFRGVTVRRCPVVARNGGAGLWRLLAPLSFAVCAAPLVIWRALRRRPHAVLCVEPTLLSAPAALIGGKLVGATRVLHVQDLEIDAAFAVGPLRSRCARAVCGAVERMLLRRFDRIVTISGRMREALMAKGVRAERVTVIRNWVDLAAISARPRREDNPFRAVLGLGPQDRVALYAGHLGVKQALTVLLDAARRLKHDANTVVVIAGDGPLRDRIIADAADLPNVRFLPLQPPERFNDLLNLADVHVLPQDRAAADLVLPSKLGAMLASGRPIAVTADDGTELAEILDGIALVVTAGDGERLAGAIRQALSEDMTVQVEKGMHVAMSLGAACLLPAFERVLVPAGCGRVDAAVVGGVVDVPDVREKVEA